MAAELILHEHRRCRGVYCSPENDKIETLATRAPERLLTPRRAADLLNLPLADAQEFTDSGALRTTADPQGRDAVKAADLSRFVRELKPVAFSETTIDEEAAEPPVDSDESTDTDQDADAIGVAPAPPMAATETRRNPNLEGDVQPAEAGWVKVRLADLAHFFRTGEFGPAAPTAPAAPAAPSAPAPANVRSLPNRR